MKRPNLVNPSQWSPFKSIPIISPVQVQPQVPDIPIPIIPTIPVYPPTRKELIQKNSLFLNLIGLVIIISISYFLYSIYLERKIFTEYLNYIENIKEETYPGFF